MSRECKIYQEELRGLGYGLPLYEPNPSGYDHVRIADVGYANKATGYFHRIFNALLPSDNPINLKYGTPLGFSPLPQENNETISLNGISAGSWLHLSHVKRIDGEVDFSASGAAAHASVSFSVSSHQAAALYIKHCADRKDAARLEQFKKYMLRNYRSWLKFIRDDLGFGVGLRDLIFVTGHDLTANWATATFVGSAVHQGAKLNAGKSPVASVGASLSGTWESSISIPIRTGPNLFSNQSGPQESDAGATEPFKNQCIFIRGFRISEKLLVPRIIKAAASPEDLNIDRDCDSPSGVVSVDFDSDEGEVLEKSTAAHDIAFDALFDLSGAAVAIIHENDVSSVLDAANNSSDTLTSFYELKKKGLEVTTRFDPVLRKIVGTFEKVEIQPMGRTDSSVLMSSTETPSEPHFSAPYPYNVPGLIKDTDPDSTPSSTYSSVGTILGCSYEDPFSRFEYQFEPNKDYCEQVQTSTSSNIIIQDDQMFED
ncbi:hypothetical protein EW145_g1246 [Phellinidium pouzarii]|uniref:Uncharacterized protein n=1 Tax=Phellinidium pouzarii TaxID=167371 RepID=A0A4S4LGZ7_9AGAM|nr:hypothetical protein EW145_g1246 [Phellinidium pouzarii]